jgi:hypothetical protein
VKVIEHGQLMDEASARLMAEKGVWLSFQPFTDDGHVPPMAPANLLRLKQVFTGTERTVELAKKHKLKMAFGTDILFSAAGAARRGSVAACALVQPPEAIMATGTNGIAGSCQARATRTPAGWAWCRKASGRPAAVDGNPARRHQVVEAGITLVVIMKDGRSSEPAALTG